MLNQQKEASFLNSLTTKPSTKHSDQKLQILDQIEKNNMINMLYESFDFKPENERRSLFEHLKQLID